MSSTILTPAQKKARGAGIASGRVRAEKAEQRRIDEAVRRLVDSAPKLSEQQRATIGAALRGA